MKSLFDRCNVTEYGTIAMLCFDLNKLVRVLYSIVSDEMVNLLLFVWFQGEKSNSNDRKMCESFHKFIDSGRRDKKMSIHSR